MRYCHELLARWPACGRGFVPLPERELLFSAWPEESNPKRGHPADAPSGHSRIESGTGSALRVRESRPGFSTGLLPRRKVCGIPAAHPAGLFVRVSPPHRGPGRAARFLRALFRKATTKAQAKARARALHTLAPSSRSGDPSARRKRAALPGAPRTRRVDGGPARRVADRRSASFSTAQDVLPKNPGIHPRTRRAEPVPDSIRECPEGASAG